MGAAWLPTQWPGPTKASPRQVGHAQKLDNLRTLAHANITFGRLRTQPGVRRDAVAMARHPSDVFECAALSRAMRQQIQSEARLRRALREKWAEFLSWLFRTKIIQGSQTAQRKCMAELI